MAIVNMTSVQVGGKTVYEYSSTKAAAGSGDSILIPPGVTHIGVTVTPTTCNAKCQTTTDSAAVVNAGTETWNDWKYGLVGSSTTGDCVPAITAVKLVQVGAGSSAMSVVAR